MNCPYCDFDGGLTAIHRHLVETHTASIITGRDEQSGKMHYSVSCPFCQADFSHRVKPRSRNPRFLEEFKTEIALVAFDQLLYHLVEEHTDRMGVPVDT